MSWLGANEVFSSRKHSENFAECLGESGNKINSASNITSRENQETVEAALNRISKAYVLAMECVGALHRADAQVCRVSQADQNLSNSPCLTSNIGNEALAQKDEISNEFDNDTKKLIRIGTAARNVFENLILLDPLVADQHATLLHYTLARLDEKYVQESILNLETGKAFADKVDSSDFLARLKIRETQNRRRAATVTSSGHKFAVKRIAYLSLVNYGDLLIMGLPQHQNLPQTVLDRGLITNLRFFGNECTSPNFRVWKRNITINANDGSNRIEDNVNLIEMRSLVSGSRRALIHECEKDTVRLAVVAYLDATTIDGSDPTLWLKLACASRRLGRLLEHEQQGLDIETETIATSLKYRRLEKFALERAVSCFESHEVPNRTAIRAYQQWDGEAANQKIYVPKSFELKKVIEVDAIFFLDMNQHSWTSFGWILLKVCKQGTTIASTNSTSLELRLIPSKNASRFATLSPKIILRLSPLLVLPKQLIAVIATFLNNNDRDRLIDACSSVSQEYLSYKGFSNESTERAKAPQTEKHRSTSCTIPEDKKMLQDSLVILESEKNAVIETTTDISHASPKRRACRVSSRLKSQVMASEKRSERSKRQQSAEYCLIAAIFGCDQYDERYTTSIAIATAKQMNASDKFQRDDARNGCNDKIGIKSNSVRTMTSSLLSFFDEWRNIFSHSSAIVVLFRFVVHTAMNVSDIFSDSEIETLALSSCLLECYNTMECRSYFQQHLISSWQRCRLSIPREVHLNALELFALDLLHAELRLKRCELQDFDDTDYDGDGCFLSAAIRNIQISMSEIEDTLAESVASHVCWHDLKARSLWLCSNYFLWCCKISSNLSEGRENEKECLRYVENLIEHLNQPRTSASRIVYTPHLVSSKRKGHYWRQLSSSSLGLFTSEIQASSVVLQSREQYSIATSKIGGVTNESLPSDSLDFDVLLSIGKSLLERYQYSIDSSSAKYTELIDDFISVHGNILLGEANLSKISDKSCNLITWFDNVIYFGKVCKDSLLHTETPCLLTIITRCLQVKNGYYSEIALLLLRLVMTLLVQLASFLQDDCEVHEEVVASRYTMKRRQYCILVVLLVGKLNELVSHFLQEYEKLVLVLSRDFCELLTQLSAICTNWFVQVGLNANEGSDNDEDINILCATKELVRTALSKFEGTIAGQPILKVYFPGLARILGSQRKVFDKFSKTKPEVKGRSNRIRIARRRADFVAVICFEISVYLSKNPFTISNGQIVRSIIFSGFSKHELCLFVHDILCLWKICTEKPSDMANGEGSYIDAYLDSFGRDRFRIPLATLIVGLCGSCVTSVPFFSSFIKSIATGELNEQATLAEFYDSDCSANELDDEDDEKPISDKVELLRVVMQTVHCVSNVFVPIPEGELNGYSFLEDYLTKHGHLLPLVVVRVLNKFSNCLLLEFAENCADDMALWAKEYPVGTRTIGFLLDSILHKAYKCLHGFSLLHSSTSDVKDSVSVSTQSGGTGKKNIFPPENTSAVASLYRCIIRAYAQGRKSPPKAALDFVLDALPQNFETETGNAIHRFLYANEDKFTLNDVVSLMRQQSLWDVNFPYPELVRMIQESCDNISTKVEDECVMVRRGVSSLIAQGTLPQYQDNGDMTNVRAMTHQAEEELSRKFLAVIDDIRFNKHDNVEGWFKASQCLIMKAELIADRIGLSKGYSRNQNFYRADNHLEQQNTSFLADLLVQQEREYSLKTERWTETLGFDLSLFVRYNWSSLDSLRLLSAEIERLQGGLKDIQTTETNIDTCEFETSIDANICYEINSLLVNNNLVAWQQAWGGLFVSSLRLMARRCLHISIFAASRHAHDSDNLLLMSEITESLGVLLYSELLASQTYGYPMHVTPDFRKRKQAIASLSCFERTIEIIAERIDEATFSKFTWDSYFMIGKCHEKIAKTYVKEKFTKVHESSFQEQPSTFRKYEHHMSEALKNYAIAIKEAQEMERNGEFAGEQVGGSNHGASEAVYRLHATRLKCVLTALLHRTTEKEMATEEALRLTESNWFNQPSEYDTSSMSYCDRALRVLSDVVSALAQCRLDNTFFHRSVYRHAQALMWAPVFYNHFGGIISDLPASWAVHIRGLNPATDAASSAAVVISSLFDRKRTQLCAVWVTESGSMSSYQTLNNCVRKYDSLRGKYISAYVDSLRLCNRSKELETFLRWTYMSNNDLPALFATTVEDKAKRSHSHDCLLLEGDSLTSLHFVRATKRMTNKALATVILHEINEAEIDSSKEFFENKLKVAYACLLRLNCDPKKLINRWAWKIRGNDGVKEVMEAMVAAYVRIFGFKHVTLPEVRVGWSVNVNSSNVASAALKKCKEILPTLSGNWFSIQKPAKPKNKASTTNSEENVPEENGSTKVTFDVTEGKLGKDHPRELRTKSSSMISVNSDDLERSSERSTKRRRVLQ